MTVVSSQTLPPELLGRIFEMKIRDEQSGIDVSRIHTPNFSVLYNILFVCRYWYYVAIGCPRLWDFISLSFPPDHVERFLARSKQVPLRIQPTSSWNQPQAQDPESLKLILQVSHRIQHLYLMITWDIGRVLMDSRLPITLPMIESLNIDRRIWSPSPEAGPEGPLMLERLLSLPFPFKSMTRLSTLYISGYTLREVEHFFQPSIRKLSLLLQDEVAEEQDEDWEDGIAPRIDEMLEVLRGMPLLEDVDIPTWLDNAHPLPSRFPVVSPQNLQVLKMQLSSPDTHYLQHMSFSPGIRLNITIQCSDLDGGPFRDVFVPCVLACGLATPGSTGLSPIRSLELHQSPHWTFSFKCWTVDATLDKRLLVLNGENGTLPVLEIDFEYSTGSYMPEVYEAVTQCLDLTSAETLALSLTPDEDWWSDGAVEEISRGFSSMQELRTLIAIEWPLERFYQLVAGPQESPDTPLIFRKLETVYLPHLPPITTADEILRRLLAPGTNAAEQLRQFHIWLHSLKDCRTREDLEELKLRLPAIYVELEAPKDIDYNV